MHGFEVDFIVVDRVSQGWNGWRLQFGLEFPGSFSKEQGYLTSPIILQNQKMEQEIDKCYTWMLKEFWQAFDKKKETINKDWWGTTNRKNPTSHRSSRSQMFFKVAVLKYFAIFTGKHLWSLFLKEAS